jgi:hypothetical protein
VYFEKGQALLLEAAPSVQRMKRKPVEVTAVTVELEPPYCAVCGLTPLMEPPTPDV